MMEYSQYGALAQLFIIDAISKLSAAVSKADPAKMGNGLIDGTAWVGVAKEIRAKMDAHLGVKTEPACEQCGEAFSKEHDCTAGDHHYTAS